jgi:HlyD family secretion protein
MNRGKYLIFIILIAITAIIIVFIGIAIQENKKVVLQGVIECREYRVASKIAGKIETLHISEGDSVTIGELLYTISTPELQTKLSQAIATKDAAMALDKQTISGARQQQIDAAYNLWQKASAGRELAQKSFERIANLHAKGVVTTQQLDEATANLEAMRATESAAYAEYSLALAGATKEQKDAAAANVNIAQGAIDEITSYISDGTVISPISGEVSTVAYYPGEVVGAGFPVVTILDLDDLWAEFNIKENLLPHFTIGTTLIAYIPAIDKHIPLVVSYISPQADFAIWNATRAEGGFDIRTFVVKLKPTDNKSKLRPGMSAIIEL